MEIYRDSCCYHNARNRSTCKFIVKGVISVTIIHGKQQQLNLSNLQWRHNGRDSVSNHQPHDCLLSRLFRRRSKKTSNLRVTGLCVGNSPVTSEFPAQMVSNAENVSIWWRHDIVCQLAAIALTISQNVPFRTEMCTFLFWMMHCGIWNMCIVELVN